MTNKKDLTKTPRRVGKAQLPVSDAPVKNSTSFTGMLESLQDLKNPLGFETFDPGTIELGTIIRRARETQGLSQTELGQRTGLTQNQVSLIEGGRMPDGPSYRTLRPILSILGVRYALQQAPKAKVEDWVRLAPGSGDVKLNDEMTDIEACASIVKSMLRGVALKEARKDATSLLASAHGRSSLFEPGACGFWSTAPGKSGRLTARKGVLVMGIGGAGHVSKTSKTSVPSSDQVVIASGRSNIEVSCTGQESFDFLTVPLTMEIADTLGARLSA